MRSTLAWRWSMIGFGIAAALLVGVQWTIFRRLADLSEATGRVEHSLLVRTEADGILSLLKDAETGQRGFLITGVRSYLEPYETAVALISPRVERLRRLTADSTTQRARVGRLDGIVRVKLEELRETVAMRQRDGFEAAARRVATGAGRRAMDEARVVVKAIDADEDRLLSERQVIEARQAQFARIASLGGLGAALGLLAAATVLMGRAIEQRERERARRVTMEAIAAAVGQSEELLRVTIASIGDAVIATDDHGRVRRLNAVAEALTGWTEADAMGQPLEDVFVILNEESRRPAPNPVQAVLREGVIAGLANHTVLVSKIGRDIPIDDSAAPIKTADGRMVGVVLVFRDVTERRRAERELELAKSQAERANLLKDQFLAMLSHELRTPMNAILGWADMLRSGLLQDSLRDKAASAIYANGLRQAQLISELLDVSRIMSGKLQVERTAVDLQEIVRSAAEVVQSSADAKRIRIVVDADASIGTFYGDATRLQQILWNLLMNAIKFTPEEGTVRVQVNRADAGVELSVIDTGRGISAAFLPFVFEPFQQEGGSTTRRHGGLGLGLSIVRHLAEAHGGTVTAESAGEGHGATFTVRLPIMAVYPEHPEIGMATQPAESGPLAADPGPRALQGLSVLVVDDDDESRDLVAATLESYGAVAVPAVSAEDARRILGGGQHVDVLLSDVAMPDEDGYSLIRTIRASEAPGARRLPAAALTSYARDEDRRQALLAGFQLHLAKPIDSRSLIEAVARLAQRDAGVSAHSGPQPSSTTMGSREPKFARSPNSAAPEVPHPTGD